MNVGYYFGNPTTGGCSLSLSLSLSADNLPMRLYRRTVNTVTYTKWMSDPMDILKIQRV